MNVFLARQPIFDLKKQVYAYEILYRSGSQNSFTGEIEDDQASSKVVFDTFQSFGLENLTGGKPAFINFPATLIHEEIATLFPQEYLVVELLETVEPTPRIVEKCRELKELGYLIALDDFVYNPQYEDLMNLVDIIKVDFLQSSLRDIVDLKVRLRDKSVILLAEKVEAWDEFHMAVDLGFELFQGYFFSKPEIVTTGSLSPLEINYLQLINKVTQEEIDFEALSEIVTRDLALTFNLLKLVNSVYFGQRTEIKSVKQALIFLGEKEIRKWITLISLQGLAPEEFQAQVSISLIRARFAELLAQVTDLHVHQDELFLTGLFSMLDVLLKRPLPQILKEVETTAAVKEALLHGTGPFEDILTAVISYERGGWDSIGESAKTLGVDPTVLGRAYLEALQWHPNLAALE